MRRPIQGLCWILFIFSFQLQGKPKIPTAREIEKIPTPIENITRWKDLPGGNYVIGYGPHPANPEKEVALAIYDKTFRNLLSSEFLKKSWLFAFGFESRSLSHMARDLNRAKKTQSSAEEEQEKEETFSQFLTGLENTKSTIVFKKDFWKKKYWKWKPDRKLDLSGPSPEVIYLSDLDMNAMTKGNKKFKLMKEKLPLLVAGESKQEDSEDIIKALESAKLVRMESGEYSFDSGDIELFTPPVKIIDLVGKYSSYRWSLKYALSTLTMKSSMNFIPFYGPPQAAAAMMERIFNLTEVTYLIRHGMALNLVMEALEGNPNSPFYNQLDQQQLEDAGSYLLLSRTMISSLISNATGHDKVFRQFWKESQKKKKESIRTLEKRDIQVFPLANSFYAIGKKQRKNEVHSLKIYSLLKSKALRPNKPVNVVDFEHTRAEYRKRNLSEGALIALRFTTIPIINVGGFVNFFFKEIFVRELHRRQIQEAGFRSLLLNHPHDFFEALAQAGYDTQEERQVLYMKALGIVEDREINQFDLKTIEHAHWRKKVENWIVKKDNSYKPEPFNLPALLREDCIKPTRSIHADDIEFVEL